MMTNDDRLTTRRRILVTGAAATLALAGCLGDDDGTDTDDNAGDDTTTDDTTTDDTVNGENGDDPGLLPVVEDPPDAVYHPTHHEAFRMLPTVEAGDYALLPHFTSGIGECPGA